MREGIAGKTIGIAIGLLLSAGLFYLVHHEWRAVFTVDGPCFEICRVTRTYAAESALLHGSEFLRDYASKLLPVIYTLLIVLGGMVGTAVDRIRASHK